MKRKVLRERPLEYLRRKADGQPFPEETIKNMYVARAYVLDLLKDTAIAPDSSEHLHIAVQGDSPLMLAVARQLALSCHFVNYRENDVFGRLACANRTVVTIVTSGDAANIISELRKEEYLCNLLQCCKYTVAGTIYNPDSFLDIEFEITDRLPESSNMKISEDAVKAFAEAADPDTIYTIDTRKAIYNARVYDLGAVIDNLPAEDIHSAKRYMLALDTFKYKLLEKKISPLVKEAKWSTNLTAVKNGLSNLFCADLFESRLLGVKRYAKEHGVSERVAWESNNAALTISEHNRWTVEKLVMGYRPMSGSERLQYEELFAPAKAAYGRQLKNNVADPSHIDICSSLDLRRSDPESLKYDSFLLLAIPIILEKLKHS